MSDVECPCLKALEKSRLKKPTYDETCEGEWWASMRKEVPRRIRFHHSSSAIADYYDIIEVCENRLQHNPWTFVHWYELPYWLNELGYSGYYEERENDWIEQDEKVDCVEHDSKPTPKLKRPMPYKKKEPNPSKMRIVYKYEPPPPCKEQSCLFCSETLTDEDLLS